MSHNTTRLFYAGPVPFTIRSQSPLYPRCLSAVSSPYSAGQAPVFTSDCSGVSALWTYDNASRHIKVNYEVEL